MRAEVPRAVNPRDRDMDGVLDPLADPIHGKGHDHDEANDFASRAPASSTCWIGTSTTVRLVLGVDRNQSHRVPGAEGRCDESSQKTNKIDVSVLLCDIDTGLEHEHAERYPRNPRDEADDREDAEKQKDDTSRIVLLRKHVYANVSEY